MKTLSQGRTARLRAAVDRYEALDFESRIGNGFGRLPPSARANIACPALRMASPPFPLLSDSTHRTNAT